MSKRNFIKYAKKASAPNRAEALKNYAIFRFSCKPSVTISSVAKTSTRKVPSPETRINTGLFGTSKPKGTTPTRRGLNNSAYVILLFVSLSVLILRFICIILC